MWFSAILSIWEHTWGLKNLAVIPKINDFWSLRSVRPLAAKKCHKQLIFSITDRYNTKKFNNSWYHMGGRMGGRHMNENSRQSRIFNLKLIFNHKYTSKSMGRPPIRPPCSIMIFFVYFTLYLYNVQKIGVISHIFSCNDSINVNNENNKI